MLGTEQETSTSAGSQPSTSSGVDTYLQRQAVADRNAIQFEQRARRGTFLETGSLSLVDVVTYNRRRFSLLEPLMDRPNLLPSLVLRRDQQHFRLHEMQMQQEPSHRFLLEEQHLSVGLRHYGSSSSWAPSSIEDSSNSNLQQKQLSRTVSSTEEEEPSLVRNAVGRSLSMPSAVPENYTPPGLFPRTMQERRNMLLDILDSALAIIADGAGASTSMEGREQEDSSGDDDDDDSESEVVGTIQNHGGEA